VTSNVTSLGTAADLTQAIVGRVYFSQSAGVHDDDTGSYPYGGFARDFATADGERVRVEAFNRSSSPTSPRQPRSPVRLLSWNAYLTRPSAPAMGYTPTAPPSARCLHRGLSGTPSQSWLSSSQEPRRGACTFTTSPARFSPSTSPPRLRVSGSAQRNTAPARAKDRSRSATRSQRATGNAALSQPDQPRHRAARLPRRGRGSYESVEARSPADASPWLYLHLRRATHARPDGGCGPARRKEPCRAQSRSQFSHWPCSAWLGS
jgi:hypothetical protein